MSGQRLLAPPSGHRCELQLPSTEKDDGKYFCHQVTGETSGGSLLTVYAQVSEGSLKLNSEETKVEDVLLKVKIKVNQTHVAAFEDALIFESSEAQGQLIKTD